MSALLHTTERYYQKQMAKLFLPSPSCFIKNNKVDYDCIAEGVANYVISNGDRKLKVYQDDGSFYAIYTWNSFQYKVPFELISKYLWGRK